MADFEYVRTAKHPYNWGPDSPHGHFAPTRLRHPKYSAAAVPFSWLLRENMESRAEEHELDVQVEREPDLGFKTEWVQELANQRALLDCFSGHIKADKSLCFFYAKQVPLVEENGQRVLIGVGRVLHVSSPLEYEYSCKSLTGKLRSVLWELMVQHSIRPNFKDGFLLPYHAALELGNQDPTFDPESIVAFAPEDRQVEFSFGSQLVTHDGAIAALLACAQALRAAEPHIAGPWSQCLNWIDERMSELWNARGAFPGLGVALTAFGLQQGTFIAHSVMQKVSDNGDPWSLVESLFDDPDTHLPVSLSKGVGKTICEKWKKLPSQRKALLKLLSRFELSKEQAEALYVQEERAKAGVGLSDSQILENPYLLYEITRLSSDPISVSTVDRGVFPSETIRERHRLPQPSELDSGTDARRVRAFAIKVLEDAASDGHSLLPQSEVVLRIRDFNIEPGCPVDADLMAVAKQSFADEIRDVEMADKSVALKLTRLAAVNETIRIAIEKRLGGKRLVVESNWRQRLDEYLSAQGTVGSDELEESARTEKAAALKELAESRFSILIGPAGTGKTTLLSVLCAEPQIADEGILLLAPTGKARVRMEHSTKKLKLKGYTIAQFLSPSRYDSSTGRYRLSDKPVDPGVRTVVIDEASMLTEEMLAATIEALKGVHRLVLIGDPRQLPPIGTGRPFVDIVRHLAPEGVRESFPRVGPGYAELTILRRQAGTEREDLQLAEWFSGEPIAPGEDEVFDRVVTAGKSQHIHFVEWEGVEDLRTRLIDVLVSELGLSGPDDIAGFDKKLGGVDWNGMRFFNFGSAEKSEEWQILAPVRAAGYGVPSLNRLVHKQFRKELVEAARKEKFRKYPKPMGPEEIVYGDKVINVVNTDPSLFWNRHRRVYPAKDNPYIANGEIGMAVGYFWRKGKPDLRWKLEVEFASQPNHKYDFTGRDFGEEGNPVLELAYALTVHKAQGSEFGLVILVLPNPCRLLSRELLYTALTRQKNRIVILHQGQRSDLRKYTSDDRSETARRLTNLFEVPSPRAIDGHFYEEDLIHRTSRGEMVRSKSEVIIADHLAHKKVAYAYEKPLTIGGVTKYPDFTIEDSESGVDFYWEHCGMLHVPRYRRRWEEKLAWYKAHDILPHDEGGGKKGTLIITRDQANGSIDSSKIKPIIEQVLHA